MKQVMKRVKDAAYGGLLATTVDPDTLLDALMDSWKIEVELAQLTVEKRMSTIFTDALHAQAQAEAQEKAEALAQEDDLGDNNDGTAADTEPEPEQESASPRSTLDPSDLSDAIRLHLAYNRMVGANRDGTLGLYRGCTPRILSAVFADGVRRWVESETRRKQASGKRTHAEKSKTEQGVGGKETGEHVDRFNLEEIQLGITSAVAGGASNKVPPVELAQAISKALVYAGLVSVPPTVLNIFPSQEKIAASASKGRKLKQ